MRDEFKRNGLRDYTGADLNCRRIVPHTKQRNKLEKIIRRKVRRKLKKSIDICGE